MSDYWSRNLTDSVIPLVSLPVFSARRNNSERCLCKEIHKGYSAKNYASKEKTPKLSFVIPIQNEERTIEELCCRIENEVQSAYVYEIILVDDGSTDASWSVISELAKKNSQRVCGIRFRSHSGKAAALMAGFRAAKGDIIFTLDGDLQDDPAEINRFLQKLAEGYDLVSGWKKIRHDPWHKTWPSRIFNRMLSRMSGVYLHDHNCGFKCYRAEVAENLTLYGELHRMIPALAAMKGYRCGEIDVLHHERRHGRSKYGFERFIRGFFDMVSVWFLRHYGERPAHFTGIVSGVMFGAGILSILGGSFWGMLKPAGMFFSVLGIVLAVSAINIWLAGLITEMLNRGGLEQHWDLRIREVTNLHSPAAQSISLPDGVNNVAADAIPVSSSVFEELQYIQMDGNSLEMQSLSITTAQN